MDEDFTGIVHVEGLRTGDNRDIITKDSFKKDQFPKTVPLKDEEGNVIGTAELSLEGDEIRVKGMVDNKWISLLYPPELNEGFGIPYESQMRPVRMPDEEKGRVVVWPPEEG